MKHDEMEGTKTIQDGCSWHGVRFLRRHGRNEERDPGPGRPARYVRPSHGRSVGIGREERGLLRGLAGDDVTWENPWGYRVRCPRFGFPAHDVLGAGRIREASSMCAAPGPTAWTTSGAGIERRVCDAGRSGAPEVPFSLE